MQIKWKKGSRISGDAEKIYNSLEKLREHGELTAGALVLKSKPVNHPAHKAIWSESDEDAAAERRLYLARRVIHSLEVIHKEAPEISTRAYETVTQPAVKGSPERKVYRDISEILKDPVQRDEVLGNAIRDAIAFRRKYNALSELSQIFNEIDLFIEKLGT